jgi:hypothetical protein
MAVGVAAVVISVATSIGASLLLSPASPMSRSLLSLTLASLVGYMRQASFLGSSTSSLARWSTLWVSGVFATTSLDKHSIPWILMRTLLLLWSHRWWDVPSRVDSTSRIDCRRLFFNCYCCCRLIALFLFREDFSFGCPSFFGISLATLSTDALFMSPYISRKALLHRKTSREQFCISTLLY